MSEKPFTEREIYEARRAIARRYHQSIDQVYEWEAKEYLKKRRTLERRKE